jgi:hypothetical protein
MLKYGKYDRISMGASFVTLIVFLFRAYIYFRTSSTVGETARDGIGIGVMITLALHSIISYILLGLSC